MSSWSVRKKEYFTLFGMTLVAVLMAGGILFWGATASLFNPSAIKAETYVPYNMQNLVVQKNDNTQGLPSYNITFDYKNDDNKQPKEVTSEGFTLLGETLDTLIKNEPAVYNIVGKPASEKSSSFEFTSSSPSDYTSDVYSKAYSSFVRVANYSEVQSVKYKSEVQPNGDRFVTLDVNIPEESTNHFALQNTWNQIVTSLTITDLTTYHVTLKAGERASVTSAFTTTQEKDTLSKIDSTVWETFAAYTDKKGAYTKFDIENATLNLSPVGNNQTTLALVVTPPADRAAFLGGFNETASKDPKVAWVTAFTTTFTAKDEPAPFFIQYPSNREW